MQACLLIDVFLFLDVFLLSSPSPRRQTGVAISWISDFPVLAGWKSRWSFSVTLPYEDGNKWPLAVRGTNRSSVAVQSRSCLLWRRYQSKNSHQTYRTCRPVCGRNFVHATYQITHTHSTVQTLHRHFFTLPASLWSAAARWLHHVCADDVRRRMDPAFVHSPICASTFYQAPDCLHCCTPRCLHTSALWPLLI